MCVLNPYLYRENPFISRYPAIFSSRCSFPSPHLDRLRTFTRIPIFRTTLLFLPPFFVISVEQIVRASKSSSSSFPSILVRSDIQFYVHVPLHPSLDMKERERERKSVLVCLNQFASLRRKRISCFLITVETVNSPAGPRSLAFW